MKSAITKFLMTFVLFVVLFVLQKPVFMFVYSGLISDCGFSDYLNVTAHGLAMDLCTAAYLTIIPGLIILIESKITHKVIRIIEKIYYLFVSLIISLVFWVDLVLYGYWGFRLDMTPVFYFTTSPVAALASAEWWQIIFLFTVVLVFGLLLYLLFIKTLYSRHIDYCRGWKRVTVISLLLLLLIIPIRGSVTVSTMNPSRAYFSQNQRLNHAAVNPMFSLMYSAAHQSSYNTQFRFMDSQKARMIIDRLILSEKPHQDTSDIIMYSDSGFLKTNHPDIYIIVLESFSSKLMPSLGGDSIALGLDSVASEGILFTNIYAGSFRTDRALPAIFSALPPQPSESVLKYVDIIESLPSLPKAIKKLGYNATYYYGGDANFTNMMAYLMSLGIDEVISDKDFPISKKTSKWGAHDDILFERVISDLSSPAANPTLRIIQTSSSHEPFDVPYSDSRFANNARLNSFAFTDRCVSSFVKYLKNSGKWDNSLLVFIPDHWGVWPEHTDDPVIRHHIPLIITGGAMSDDKRGLKVRTLGQQTDLAATLLCILSINDSSQFPFSKNLLMPGVEEFAFFSDPNLMGLITPSDTTVLDPFGENIVSHKGGDMSEAKLQIEAYLQLLYEYLTKLK